MKKSNKIIDIIIILIAAIVTLILLVPIIRVGLHNYATGDDYKFSIYTHQGLRDSGIIGALLGSLKMVGYTYETWQGTWFTIFLFSLAPQNFGAGMYACTVFISLGALLLAEYTIIKRYLYNEYKFSMTTVTAFVFMVFNISVQYIPRTTSGIFWFNGVMHYTIPLLIALGCISCTRVVLNSNEDTSRKHALRKTAIILGLIALGGSNYLAAIIGLFGVGYEVFIFLIDKWRMKDRNVKKLSIPIIAIALEFVGLFVSYKSPGNDIRSFDDMSFRPKYFLKCIWWSIDRSRTDIIKYFSENPILFLFLIIIVCLVGLEVVNHYRTNIGKENGKYALIKNPLWALLFVNGAHMASYMPEVYAHSDFSGGVPNTHFQMILLVTLADVVIVWDLILRLVYKRIDGKNSANNTKMYSLIISSASVIVMVCICAGIVFGKTKTTNDYCNEYIDSGRMAEYELIRKTQHIICTSDNGGNVTIPEYYDDVYPLCHMSLSGDKEAWFNDEMARYYGLETITAYDFKEDK